MIDSELYRYGIRDKNDEYNNSDIEVMSKLSNRESEYYREIKALIKNWNVFRGERSKIYDDLKKMETEINNKREGITTFEKLSFYYIDDKKIDYLYDVVRGLFEKGKRRIIRTDKMLDELMDRIRMIRIDIRQYENIEKLDVDTLKEVARLYEQLVRELTDSWGTEYNDIVEKYCEYKEGNISAYSMIRKLCEYI
ncbi:hypothetical protein BUZ69_11975 [Staphylococcus saprophyticus]|nr:hypothetical protein BUZ69_11975 [Staphylococcus saprophyticus]